MKIELKEKPQGVTIIEGFPGFGFVSTIAAEYLLDHLKVRSIGMMWSEELPPMAVIHDKKIIQPLEIFYNEKYNLVIIEGLTGAAGLEWDIADALIFLYQKLNAKEIISTEGIGSPILKDEPEAYYYTNQPERIKIFEEKGMTAIKEGIILGVTGALMIKASKDIKLSCIFAETASGLPDSKSAAKIVEMLDKYLSLEIDYKPLVKRAGEFEEKIKGLLDRTKETLKEKKAKEASVGYIS